MAGVKVTDLTVLPTADPTDVMYIVDTSSNTSKQIAVGDMFLSDSWTPTFDTFTDAIIDATLSSAIYQRVGNVITCSMSLTLDVDFSANNTGFCYFTLPFSTTTGTPSGSLSSSNITQRFNGAVRSSGTTKGRIVMTSEDTSLITSTATCHVIFQYLID
jgi:hypothetical protein